MNKKIKIEIKNRWTGNILFEYEKENNTLKDTLIEAIKQGAYLEGAYLGGAYLGGAYLEGANLGGAYLGGANLGGAYLGGAYLEGANLGGAYLGGAYLEGANLEGANLGGANLGGAYLGGANLGGAYLGGANLGGANLEGANLGGANLEGAYIYVNDNDINVEETIKDFEENAGIKITEHYINHDVIPTRWNCFWRNGLIIREWEIKEPEKEVKEMTLEQVCEELGYEVKIINE